MKKPSLLASAAIALLAAVQAIAPVSAQNQGAYTYPAPAPGRLVDSGNSPEALAADPNSTIYGGWDFTYARTPDNNLFVTRVFLGDIGNRTVVGATMQVDCGRGMFRHVVTPVLFRNGSDEGEPLDWGINEWGELDRGTAFGQAMMRTCETAAQEEGMVWSWF